MADSANPNDKLFAAYTLGQLLSITSDHLDDRQRAFILEQSFNGLKARYNEVGGDFSCSLKHFTGAQFVPYEDRSCWTKDLDERWHMKVEFWSDWIKASKYKTVLGSK